MSTAAALTVDWDAVAAAEAAVEFVEEPHRYYMAEGGGELAGCTTSLEGVGLDDWSQVPPDVLLSAQIRGRQAHEARHIDDVDGDLDESSITTEVLGHLNGWRRFRREQGFDPVLSEQLVYAPPGNTRCQPAGGTLDAVGIVHRPTPRLVLADLKTGSQLPNGVGPQTAGYALMLRLLGICDVAERWAVQTFADGRYRVHPLEEHTDLYAFVAAVWFWHWKRRGGR